MADAKYSNGRLFRIFTGSPICIDKKIFHWKHVAKNCDDPNRSPQPYSCNTRHPFRTCRTRCYRRLSRSPDLRSGEPTLSTILSCLLRFPQWRTHIPRRKAAFRRDLTLTVPAAFRTHTEFSHLRACPTGQPYPESLCRMNLLYIFYHCATGNVNPRTGRTAAGRSNPYCAPAAVLLFMKSDQH